MAVMDAEEEYFPRGGAKNQKKSIRSDRTYVFESNKPQVVRKKKLGRKERQRENAKKIILEDEVEEEEDELEKINIQETFTYKTLRDGTLCICSIVRVINDFIVVALPERLLAKVPMKLFSNPLKDLIEKNPGRIPSFKKKYFPIGYCLPCRIINTTIEADKNEVIVSTDPYMVNGNFTFDSLPIGCTIIAAVQSCEDHGYIMETGIAGVKAFLPDNNTGAYIKQFHSELGSKLLVGQLVWCIVIKSSLNEKSNVVQLSVKPSEVSSAKLNVVSSPKVLIPGVQVNVTVVKATPKLLFVKELTSNEKGYIPNTQLENIWSNTSDYPIGTELEVSVLFKLPLTDMVCYSMRIKPNSYCLAEIKNGTLFPRAKVVSKDSRGIFVQLQDEDGIYKGFISMLRLKKYVDPEKLDELFPLNNHVTVRVVGYLSLDDIYSCTTADEDLQAKGHVSEYKVGELVEVQIVKRTDGGFLGVFGKGNISAFIPFDHITDDVIANPDKKIKIKRTYSGRIFQLTENSNSAMITLCPSLVNNKPLVNFENVKVGEDYYGMVHVIKNESIVVMFFNKVKRVLRETQLLKPALKYNKGEVVKCYILKCKSNKETVVTLSKPLDLLGLKIGCYFPIIVKSITNEGLRCIVLENNRSISCFLPVGHLSDHFKSCQVLLKNYKVGVKINHALLYSFDEEMPIFTLKHSVKKFFENNKDILENGFNALKENISLPATIAELNGNKMLLIVPLPGYNGKVSCDIPEEISKTLQVGKSVDVVVKNVQLLHKKFTVCCEKKIKMLEMNQLRCYLREMLNHFTRNPGEEVNVKVQSVDDHKIEVVMPNSNTGGVIVGNSKTKVKKGQEIIAIYLYEDIFQRVARLCLKSGDFEEGESKKRNMKIVQVEDDFCVGIIPTVSINTVVFLNPISQDLLEKWLETFGKSIIHSDLVIKLKNGIRKMNHLNYGIVKWQTVINDLIENEVRKKKKLSKNLSAVAEDNNEEVEEDDDINVSNEVEVEEELIMEKSKRNKRKLKREKLKSTKKSKVAEAVKEEETVDVGEKLKEQLKSEAEENLKIFASLSTVESHKRKRSDSFLEMKEEDNANRQQSPIKMEKKSALNFSIDESIAAKTLKQKKLDELANFSLENVGGFDWNATPADLAKATAMGKAEIVQEDSDDEVVIKKKLTPAEKKAAQMDAERLLREKEEELLRSEQNPQSADQFDRLLLSKPNDSKLWIQYMAFHLQGTDIDKARSVARRALKQINVREEQERLNVWVALLNLENMYGSSENFEQTLSEALKYNDDYQIYMKTLIMYCDSQKVSELDKLTNHLVRKFKDKANCWLECQSALMTLGLVDKARNFLQRSLTSLPQKEHISLISRFALLENKHGYHEQAQTLFENLLTSYPQRIDLWNVYVDMLVKSGSIDLARTVLERIQSHKLPVRKMRAVYKKWLQFEEKYGNEKTVERVRQAAVDYVSDFVTIEKENDDESRKKNEEEDDEENSSDEESDEDE